MSFNAGAAIGTLGLDTNPYEKGFLRASSIMQTFPSLITSFMAGPLTGIANIAGLAMRSVAAAFSEAAGAIVDAVKEVGHAADEAGEAAEKAGVSVEFFTAVSRVAADAGSSVEGFADSLKFLNKNMADALSGDKGAQGFFSSLGVQIADAAGIARTTESVWFDVADAINSLSSPAAQTRAAMGLLGRGGADMLGVFHMGSAGIKSFAADMKALGGSFDDAQAKAGDTWGKLGTYISAAMDGIKKAVAEPILNVLEAHFEDFRSFLLKIMPQVSAVVGEGMKIIVDHLSGLSGWVSANWPEIRAFFIGFASASLEAIRVIGSGLSGFLSYWLDEWLEIVKVAEWASGKLASIPIIGDLFKGVNNASAQAAQMLESGSKFADAFRTGFNNSIGDLQLKLDQAIIDAQNFKPVAAGASGGAAVTQKNTFNLTVDTKQSSQEIAKALLPKIQDAATRSQQQMAVDLGRNMRLSGLNFNWQ